MNKKLKCLLLSITLLSCYLSKGQYFPADTLNLNKTYEAFLNEPTSYHNQMAFLDAFPKNFRDFLMVYQFQKGQDYDLTMYYKGVDHIISGLYKLDLIPDTTFCDRIIWLSLGGFWEADAPSYLQRLLHRLVAEKRDVMFERLSKLNAGQQVSFWFFYFHSRFEKTEEYNILLRDMNANYPAVIESMKLAYPAANGKVWY